MESDPKTRNFFHIPVAHFPDISARWLFKEKENIRGLLEIIAQDLVEYFDFEQIEEINRSFISDTLREQESDMVFKVPFQTSSHKDELYIYILLEHQSTIDPIMPFRVLFYMCQIWDAQRRELDSKNIPRNEWRLKPILPIVFYTGTQPWKTPLSLDTLMEQPDSLSRFIPQFDTLLLDVKDSTENELTETDHPLGLLLTVLKNEKNDKTILTEVLEKVLPIFQDLDNVQHRNALIYLSHLILFRRQPDEHDELINLVKAYTQDPEVENMMLSTAEMIEKRAIEQGKKQGREEGREEGSINAMQTSILELLQHQFGIIPETLKNQIKEIQNLQILDTIFKKALNATTL
ncbi:Rpn family recombination-promoting nuclease/putative transposase, partial [Candidatus Poribacteria bacterium]|nr:Rpn family recombination-promoting nuclease/putative transposase [Candidatus Poribacteria bacterium]